MENRKSESYVKSVRTYAIWRKCPCIWLL